MMSIVNALENAINGLMNYGPFLFWTVTRDSKSRIVRIVGFVLGMVWCMPALFICALPLIVLVFANEFAHAWRGN
jgi:hypothetical protein